MSIIPQGEDFKKAIKWLSEEQKYSPQRSLNELLQEAGLKFDLSPNEQDFLARHIKGSVKNNLVS